MIQNENGEKSTDKTSKKLFEKGGLPGPGRGHKKEELDELEDLDFWDATEMMIRVNMKSDNDSTKNQAVNTYLKWKVMKDAFDEKNKGEDSGVYSPEVLELLAMRDLVPQLGGSEGVKKILKDCPGCDKFPGKVFKFNFPAQKGAGE